MELGGIKALLMHVARKQTTEDMYHTANLSIVVTGYRADDVGCGGHRNRVLAELRKQFTDKMDPAKLQGEILS